MFPIVFVFSVSGKILWPLKLGTLQLRSNLTNKLGLTGFTKAADTVSDLRITHSLTWNLYQACNSKNKTKAALASLYLKSHQLPDSLIFCGSVIKMPISSVYSAHRYDFEPQSVSGQI